MLRGMRRKGDLGARELAVLTLVDEQPTHGYAVAALFAADGDLGRIWSLRRPLAYRIIERLRDEGLVADDGVSTGHAAPDRKLLRSTPAGREQVDAWLAAPEARIREFRPSLLYKLELLRRRGVDRRPLLEAQRRLVAARPTATPLIGRPAIESVDSLLHEWRVSQHVIAVAFLDRLLEGVAGDGAR